MSGILQTFFMYGGRNIVTQNLILHWDAGNSASYSGSGTTIEDLTSNNYDGTLVNGVGYSSSNGGILTLDGTNDYINRVSVPNFGITNRTVDMWFNVDALSPSGFRRVLTFPFDDGATDIPALTIGYGTTSTSMEVGFGSGGGSGYVLNLSFSVGVWINVVATINASTGVIIVYINNSSVGTGTYTSGGISTSPPLNIGRYNTNYGQFGDFSFGNLKIYDRILSSTELTQNFNAEKSRYGL